MNRIPLRNAVIALVSLLVLALVGYLAYERIKQGRVSSLTPTAQLVSDTGLYTLPVDQTPALVPEDLPIPDDAALMESFELATRDGDVQGTRSYVSTRTVAEERAAYEAYVKRAGWTVVDSQDGDSYAALLAEQGSRQLLVSFSARTGKTYVSVSAVAAPANQ